MISIFLGSCSTPSLEISKKTTNWLENPVGISVDEPIRLGWQIASQSNGITQVAYQVVVSSSEKLASEGKGDIWDSGIVKSSQSQLISLDKSINKYEQGLYWNVKVWDQEEQETNWGKPAYFEFEPQSLDGKWIGAITEQDAGLPIGNRNFHQPLMGKEENKALWAEVDDLAKRSILLRKSIELEKRIEKATVHISGLGHYEFRINGEKIGNSEFAPLWSDYDKTVYFNTFEVTGNLVTGENVFGVTLGNGMYNVSGDRYAKFLVSFGPPTLMFKMKLTYEDGTTEELKSDESWKYHTSPIVFNCVFGGEDYDANLAQNGWDSPGFEDTSWQPVVIQNGPSGKLRPQLASAVKIQKQFDIHSIEEPIDGVYVFDMGQNISGFPSIKVKGEKGQKVRLYVGEHLNTDGTVGQKRSGGPHYYEYTLSGNGEETWQPKFSYYGFQYIQVADANIPGKTTKKNSPTLIDVKANFIYNDVEEIGGFESSNDIFNKTHLLINNAVKSNMQAVFTDCPHREKLGWLEETHLNGPGLFFNYNLSGLAPKIMQDMVDAQHASGLVPNIAPEYVEFGGDFTDSPEWGVAVIILPWMYYEFYGDDQLLRKHFESMKQYVDYLTSKSSDQILSHGLGDWYDYGDHAAGYAKNSPIALSATAHYYFGVQTLAKTAALLGYQDDFEKYSILQEMIKEAFNKAFFDEASKQYKSESQYANAIPVFLGLVDEVYKKDVLENLLSAIAERGGKLSTGDVGNRYLYQTLARNGLNDVMYDMHNHYETPGYGFQIQFGLTTLTEQWDPRKGNSWNHFMMGQIEEWFFQSLAGITVDECNPGFKHFYIKPQLVGDLNQVSAQTASPYGVISSSWEKSANHTDFSFEIPANCNSTIVLPLSNVHLSINGENLRDSQWIAEYEEEDGNISFKLNSGSYNITSEPK
nr:alpha-L-rhamnosidase [Belliella filtrata]